MVKNFVRSFFEDTSFVPSEKFSFKNLIGNKRNIILYIISILVSKVGLVAGVNPFGIAILGAMANSGVPLLLPLLIIAITITVSFGYMALLKFVVATLVYAFTKSFIKFGDNKTGNTVKMLFSATIAELVGLGISGGLVYDGLLAVYAALTSAIFYLIFAEGIEPILKYKKNNIFSSETLMAMGVLLSVAISGIGNIQIFNISVRGIISVLIVLLLGWKRGAAVGAASGIAISIVLGLIGVGNVTTIATYGFSGLLAGIFSKFGKIGAAIGFILGNIILAFFANGSTEVIISIKEIIVASVALFAIPRKATVILDDLFDYDKALTEGTTDGYFPETTLYRLNAVSEVVDTMANNAEKECNQDNNNCDEIGKFIKTLNDNTCKRCENYEKCWQQNYHNMYETVFNSIETLQTKGEITEKEILSDVCQNKSLLVDGLNFSYQIYKVNKNWQQKMNERREQLSKQLKGVSKAINIIKEDVESQKAENIVPSSRYNLEIGMSKTKKTNSKVSGDNTIMIKLKDGKYVFGVSDGMGSGEDANKASKNVMDMLEGLLNTGFQKEDAVEMVNSVMNFNEDDRFATLDATVFDTLAGNAEFLKVSSCPTYIKRGKDVDIIQSASLPVGILNNADIDLYDRELTQNDMIVMVTDGILEANKDENKKGTWLIELLKSINPDNPQRLADIILQEAIDFNFGIVEDDMTVIVAKVKAA